MPLIRITGDAPSGIVGGKGEKIGFVFPSYYGNLPRAVRAFVEKLEIKPDTFIFTVVTMGGLGQGSVASLDTLIKSKGLRLNYGRGIHMPANYIINYNPADPNRSQKSLEKGDSWLHRIAAEIAAEVQLVKKLPITANNLYKDIEELDKHFAATDKCTNCGLCERICPVRNIQLENKKPKWQGHCEHCVACIRWCPSGAIEYGKRTQSRRRYRNPLIRASEFVRKDKN